MSQSSPAENRSSLIAGYVLGTLDDAEAEAFAQIVMGDPTVLEEIDQMQSVLEQTYEIEEIAPPPQLREKVLAAASEKVAGQAAAAIAIPDPSFSKPLQSGPSQSEILQSEPSTPASFLERSPAHWLKVAALALATTLGLSAFANFVLWRQLNQQIATVPTEQAAEPLIYTLSATELAEAGMAEVIVDPATLTAQVDAQELPAIAPNQTYALWAVLKPEAPFTTDAKGAILTTTFQVNEQGNTRKTTSAPAVFRQPELIAALGITVESASSPQSHEGAPVLLSPL